MRLGQVGIGDEHSPERDGIAQLRLNRRDRRFGGVAAGVIFVRLQGVAIGAARLARSPDAGTGHAPGGATPLLMRGIFYDGWRIAANHAPRG